MLKPTFGIQWNNVVVGLLIIIITACVFSFEPGLADTLEGQLNKIDGLFSGKLKTIGICFRRPILPIDNVICKLYS
ncbi:hypothetical protein [Orientia tsutsugamushi]|nr:hypothetical protein [Orientia tsutsugamushi]